MNNTNTEFDKEQFDSIYPDGIENNYWNISRNWIIKKSILKNKISKSRIIEIGCGRGIVVKYLKKRNIDCIGVEVSACKPIEGAEYFIKTETDALEISENLRIEYNVLMLLDVIEHIEEPEFFINKILDKYKNLENIIITVPARKEIWSNYDEFNNHFRRYDLQMTMNLIKKIKFDVVENRYFFHALYIAAKFVIKFINKRKTKIVAPRGFMKIAHKFIYYYFVIEYYLLPKKWKGSSIICVAKKSLEIR